MPSYKTYDPKGWCGDPSRGAAMGRPTLHAARKDFSDKLTLRRRYLNEGGYDENGTYFGSGIPLYWYADENGDIDGVLRAFSRKEAKRIIRETYPKARFFN